VVKAQIHAGGRGKGGGVKVAKSMMSCAPSSIQQAAHEAALGTGLVRTRSRDLAGEVAQLIHRFRDLDAAALAAAAGVDLRLHHPDVAAEALSPRSPPPRR